MTEELELGIPILKADVSEPLASIIRLLRETRYHPGEDEMNTRTERSTMDSIRFMIKCADFRPLTADDILSGRYDENLDID